MILTFSKIMLELWKLNLNPTKTEVAWFHLNKRLANINLMFILIMLILNVMNTHSFWK